MKYKFVLALLLAISFKVHSQHIYLQESFDNNSNHWYTGKDAQGTFQIDSGIYRIETIGALRHLAFTPEINTSLYASCIARAIKYKLTSSYGFYLSTQNEYESPSLFFMLNPEGYYSIFMRDGGITTPVQRWTASSFIFLKDTFNTISVSGNSVSMNLYINDFLITTFKPPLYNFKAMGVAVLDSSIAEYDELFLLAYEQEAKPFNIDPYNLPEVISFLLEDAKAGFNSVRQEPETKNGDLMESRIWIPGARNVFIRSNTYTAVFSKDDSPEKAKERLLKLRKKIEKAMPDAIMQEGFDDEGFPYFLFGYTENGVTQKPIVDLYIFNEDTEGRKYYYVAVEIEGSR